MSKSLDNCIGITESPGEMFGKLKRKYDEKMWRYFEMLSFKSLKELENLDKEVKEGLNPRDVKMQLACEIVERFHGAKAADDAQSEFINRFRNGQMPENMEESDYDLGNENDTWIAPVFTATGLTSSNSELVRMVSSGAVRIDGEKVTDRDKKITSGNTYVLQVGKRKFVRVTVK